MKLLLSCSILPGTMSLFIGDSEAVSSILNSSIESLFLCDSVEVIAEVNPSREVLLLLRLLQRVLGLLE